MQNANAANLIPLSNYQQLDCKRKEKFLFATKPRTNYGKRVLLQSDIFNMHWEQFECQWTIFTVRQGFIPDVTTFRCNKVWWIFSFFPIFLYQLYMQLLRKSQTNQPIQNENFNASNEEIKSVWGIIKLFHTKRSNQEGKQQGANIFQTGIKL